MLDRDRLVLMPVIVVSLPPTFTGPDRSAADQTCVELAHRQHSWAKGVSRSIIDILWAMAMIEQDVSVDDLTIHFYETGNPAGEALLLLHGWPESARAWFEPMAHIQGLRLLAPDLPGIGASRGRPSKADKRSLGRLLVQALGSLGVERFAVAGHDVGGIIAYALMRSEPERLTGAAIINVTVPGIDPWSKLIANPDIWHFGFHRVPDLPETLIADHLEAYFGFFYAALSGGKDRVSAEAKAAHVLAHSRPEALSAGLDWYRGFPQDAEDNAADTGRCTVPLLYIRGGKDPVDTQTYVAGFHKAGVKNVEVAVIADAGHFVLEEKPVELAEVLSRFMTSGGSSSRES
jgi:pimeloyl-ACP methyl ester carboxylesterase